MNPIIIRVHGNPVPAGQLTPVCPRGCRGHHKAKCVYSNRPALLEWKQSIYSEAYKGRDPIPRTTPLKAEITFYMPRSREDKDLVYHTKRPDLDKLIRAVLDALKGVVYEDDSQVVNIEAMKVYESVYIPTGAEIKITKMIIWP
jgi:crossover junction endodeoxyribonuclease RusA